MKHTLLKPQIIISSYDDIDNPYYGGGGAVAIHEIARRLCADYRVTVLTGMFPGAADSTVRNGVKYKRISTSGLGARIGHLAFTAQLPYYAKTLHYDIWIDSFTPPFSVSTLPLISTKPVIGLVHMLASEDMERKYKLPFGAIERAGIKWYRSFIVLSPAIKKKIQTINPQAQITMIPNGVALPKVSKKMLPPKHILYMGRIEMNQKGLDLLLNSYAKIASKISHPLVIAGAGGPTEMLQLKKLISTLDLTNRVKLVGRVTGEYKERLIRNSLCVVCPSRFETFPLIALETMSYKKCLVSFDIEGLAWIPRDHSIKIRPFQVNALANKLLHLSQKPSRAEAIGERSYAVASKYDWDASAKKFADCVAETLKSPATVPARIWQFGAQPKS
ncbi:glycosyltransferase family 4 protein [Candidatus Microgenomates bacterium]|nr:glycosyltransferase family 4 protein [Candidatus Microgenomates bacterium]